MKPLAVLMTRRKQNAADRLHGAAFAADDAAHVALGNANLDADILAVGDLVNLHQVRLGGERFDYFFDRFFHRTKLTKLLLRLLRLSQLQVQRQQLPQALLLQPALLQQSQLLLQQVRPQQSQLAQSLQLLQ